MRLKLVALFLITLLPAVPAFTQSVSTLMGGRSVGLATASVALEDDWSLWNNPAGLAGTKSANASFALHRNPALVGANRVAALCAMPFAIGSVAAGAFGFGDELYNEQLLTLGYGNRFGLASLGLRLDAIQIRAEGIPTSLSWGITFGGIAHLSESVRIGAVITNLNQPRLPNGEYLPIKMRVGPVFMPTKKLLVALELEKDIDYKPTFKSGLEYQIHKKFFARTGFNLQPNTAFFGLGFESWKLKIDYAVQHNRFLSLSHQASVGIQFRKKKPA